MYLREQYIIETINLKFVEFLIAKCQHLKLWGCGFSKDHTECELQTILRHWWMGGDTRIVLGILHRVPHQNKCLLDLKILFHFLQQI